MNKFTQKVTDTLKRTGLSFANYPSSMGFAVLLSSLAIYLIHSRPDDTKSYESLLMSFALGIPAGMAFVIIAGKISSRKIFFAAANIDTLIAVAITFLLLYFPVDGEISEVAIFRVLAAIAVFFLIFLTVPTFRGNVPDFNKMFFMTLKSFFVSFVYGLVLMLGSFFVAFAVQSLLYEDMDNKVYSYIAILSGLITYALFLGYFPEFGKAAGDYKNKIETASTQPKFAKVLFQNILIPILAALSVVLFIWSLRILITGIWPDYSQIIAIFTTYSLSGIVLYYLVTSFDNLIVRIFKRVFPIALILFLVFEAFPVIERINYYGVKPLEFGIILIWIFSFLSGLVFIFLPVEKNKITAFIAMLAITLFVLPVAGAYDVSRRSQINHLNKLLEKNDMLDGNRIIPALEIDDDDKIRITSSVEYLLYGTDKEPPLFLKESLGSMEFFRQTFGFEPAREWDFSPDPGTPADLQKTIYFNLKSAPVIIEGYSYYIPFKALSFLNEVEIESNQGIYKLSYVQNSDKDIQTAKFPEIKVTAPDNEIFSSSFEDFVSDIRKDYADIFNDRSPNIQLPQDEISLIFETDDFKIMILFNSLVITETGVLNNFFEIEGFYISFK